MKPLRIENFFEKTFETRLKEGHATLLEEFESFAVSFDAYDLVTETRQTRRRNQPDIPAAYHCDFHNAPFERARIAARNPSLLPQS